MTEIPTTRQYTNLRKGIAKLSKRESSMRTSGSRPFARRQFLAASTVGAATLVLGTAAHCVASPSSGDMFPAEPEGWKTVFADHFSTGSLSADWRPYDGRPSSSPDVQWDPKLISIRDSELVLSARRDASGDWHTGAVTNWPKTFQYGRWEIRFRAPVQEGSYRALSYHVLLWPARNAWPPEIDIAEGFAADRQRTDAFIHWRDDKGQRQKEQFQFAGDASVDATWAVEWEQDAIRLYRDDELFGSINGASVPHEPMWLAIQVEALAEKTDGTNATEPAPVVFVDWVRILQRT